MLREFQDEIARLKAQLAERQQQGSGGGGGSGGSSLGGSPDKSAAPLGAAAGGSGCGGSSSSSSSSFAADARAAAIRRSMRAELERQLRQAVTVEALAKARQAIEQQARCDELHCHWRWSS